jgi:hypothetical protein
MPRTDLRKVIANFGLLIALVICLIVITDTHLFGLSRTIGQSPKKTISYVKWKDQPVEFDTVKAAGKTLSIKAEKAQTEYKEEFDGDDDWMKGLVVQLKNASNKNIIYIKFNLSFPETDVGGMGMSHSMHFGRFYDKPYVGGSDKVLKPAEEADIPLTDDQYASLNNFLKSRNFHQVNTLEIILQFVLFEDDTAWVGGSLMKRDPFNPKAWARIDQQ